MTVEPRALVFVNQHYHPDVAATGQQLTDLAEFLADRGSRVEVLCARGRYQRGHVDVPAHEIRNGVRIRRFWTPGVGRDNVFGRLAEYLAFAGQAAVRLLLGPRPQAVVLLTTPPLLPWLGALIRRIRGVPYAIWSMDLHPEAEVAAGMLDRTSSLARVLFALADTGYRSAELVVVLGRCMRMQVLAKGVSEERTTLVPGWIQKEEVQPVSRADNPLARHLGVEAEDFVVMYSGNAGLVHEFRPFLEAADRLRHEPRIRFLFFGDGPRRGEIEEFARQRRLRNLTYHDYVPRGQLAYSLSLADVHLASLRPEFEGIAVPAKIYGAMAAARPILFLGPRSAEPARAVLEARCGAVVDSVAHSRATDRITDLLQQWRLDPPLRDRMGARGRERFLSRYEQEQCCAAFANTLSRLRATDPDEPRDTCAEPGVSL